MFSNDFAWRGAILPVLWVLALSACGWVDEGVGNRASAADAAGMYTVGVGETLTVSAEDGVLSGSPAGSSVRLSREPAHASSFALQADGAFTYTHDGGETIEDSFEYVLVRTAGESEPTVVGLRITHPPVANDDGPYEVTVGQTLQVEAAQGVLANDTDPDNHEELVAVLDAAPSHGTLTLNPDGSFTYVPETDQAREDRFTYIAEDGTYASSPANVRIAILAADDAPDVPEPPAANRPPELTTPIGDRSAAVGESFSLNLAGHFTDPDGDRLSFAAQGLPASLSLSGSTIRGTPTQADLSGSPYRVSVSARDPSGAAASDAFTLTISGGNRPPEVVSPIGDRTAIAGMAFSLDVAAHFRDPDGDRLSFAVRGLPEGLALSGSKISGTPREADAGRSFQVAITATDPAGASVSDGFTLHVAPGQVASPIARDDKYKLEKSDTLRVDARRGVLANDEDPGGKPLTARLVQEPTQGRVVLQSDGSFVYEYRGRRDKDAFTYVASNGKAESAPAKVEIDIKRKSKDDDYVVLQGDTLTVEASTGVLANDEPALSDTQALSAAYVFVGAQGSAQHYQGLQAELLSGPAYGSLTLNPDGSFTYTHGGEDVLRDSFEYAALRPDGTRSSATASIEIHTPPQAPAHCWTTPQSAVLRNVRLGGDAAPGAALTYSIATDSRLGSAAVIDPGTGELEYTPRGQGARGADTLGYRVEDTDGRVSGGTATVIVAPQVMVLGDALVAGPDGEDAGLETLHAALQAQLGEQGYVVDFVGSQQGGAGAAGLDPDHEGHAGWSPAELAYGRQADGSDGVFAWLSRHPADLVLLQLSSEAAETDPQGVIALLEEIARWQESPGGNPVTVLIGRMPDRQPRDSQGAVAHFTRTLDALLAGYPGAAPVMVDTQSALWNADGLPDPGAYRDALYPNASGYARLAERWTAALDPLLPRCSP